MAIKCYHNLIWKLTYSPQIAVSMVTAALLLYGELTAKLKSRSPHHVDVLKASISLILFSVAQLKVLFSGDETDEIINGAFVVLKDTLWTWIVDRDVIGGSVFGGCLPLDYSAIVKWKPSEELELWQSFLTLECPPDRQVTEEWYRIANSHIRKRLNEVSTETRNIACQCNITCSLVPRLPCSGTRTLKLCRRGEPGIFCQVKSAKGREEVERT